MTDNSARILYIHGFNSSPASQKAQSVLFYCRQQFPAVAVSVPQLSHDPVAAVLLLESEIAMGSSGPALLIGSSLGAYYATYLAEKHDLRAALINPAVAPTRTLREEFLGQHINPYTGQKFEITLDHINYLSTLEVNPLHHPENFLLLVQTGDEVLDYRHAVAKYAESRQVVQVGGSHSFDNFSTVLPEILDFAYPSLECRT